MLNKERQRCTAISLSKRR